MIFIFPPQIKEQDVCVESDTIITVRPSRTKASAMYYQLQHLKQHLTKVIIKGLPSVNRAVINQASIFFSYLYKGR